MAIGTPTSIGSTSSGSNPTTLTTTATVPSGALVILVACWGFGTDETAVASGGGLTWTTDQSNVFTNGYNYRFGIFSAPAPAGLASGSSLSVTVTTGTDGVLIGGCYVTGLDVSGTRVDIGTGTGGTTASWSTGAASTANAADLVIGGSFMDGTATSTPATTTPTTVELFDFQFGGNAWSLTVCHKTLSATGSQSLSGTWTGSANEVSGFVAYKAAGGGSDATVTAVVADGVGDVPSPTVAAGSSITSPVVDGVGDVPDPAVVAGSTVVPPVADGVGDIPDPTLTASSNVTSPVLDGVGGVATPATRPGLPDHFDSPDGALGASWTADPLSLGVTALTKIGGEASGANGTNFQSYWNADTFVTTGAGMCARTVFRHRPATNSGQSAYLGFVNDPGGTPVGYAVLITFGTSHDDFSVGKWLSAPLDGPRSLGRLLTSGDVIDLYVMADGTIATAVNDVIVAQAVDTTYFHAGETGYATLGFNDTTGSSQSLVAFDDFDAAQGVSLPGAVVLPPVADGVGTLPVPGVSGGATVTSPVIDGTGTLPPTNSIISAEVGTGPLIGTGGLLTPTVTSTGSGTVVAPPIDGAGDVPAPGLTADSTVVAPGVEGVGDLASPTVSASSNVDAPVVDGVGDVPTPAIGATAGAQPGPLAGTGDLPGPGLTASASVAAVPARGVGDMLAPVPTGFGHTLPRIDLPTRVVIDPMITTVIIYSSASISVVDRAITNYVLSDPAPTASLDQRHDSSTLDGRPSMVLIDG